MNFRYEVASARRRGVLQTNPCEVCHTDRNVVGHHDDYSQPLVIRWLCQSHHRSYHAELLRKQGLHHRRRNDPYDNASTNNPAFESLEILRGRMRWTYAELANRVGMSSSGLRSVIRRGRANARSMLKIRRLLDAHRIEAA